MTLDPGRMVRGCALVALALGIALTAGCEAMVPYHRHAAWDEREQTKVVLDLARADEAEVVTAIVPRDGRQPSLKTDPLDFVSRLERLVARTAATSTRPPSSWGARTSAEFFAAPPQPILPSARGDHGALVEIRPGVRGFRIERWVGDERACELEFAVESRDGAFRVNLERIAVRYSRAKVADAGWHNWWTRLPLLYGFGFDIAAIFGTEYGDGAVDMQVDLQLASHWSDASGESHFAPLALLAWTVLDVPLGGAPHNVSQAGGWLPMVPAAIRDTASGEPVFGRGQFTLTAIVTEQDELSPQYLEEHHSLGEFFDAVLSRLPIPGL